MRKEKMSAETREALGGALSGYEAVVITRNEMTDEAVNTLKDKIASIVTAEGGQVVVTDDWGRRKLAYPIQRETRGNYHYLAFTGKGATISEIERNLRMNENVLRYMTILLAPEFDVEGFKKSHVPFAQMMAARDEAERVERSERFDRGDRYDRPDRGERSERSERH